MRSSRKDAGRAGAMPRRHNLPGLLTAAERGSLRTHDAEGACTLERNRC
jgi:hypothetical protein